MTMEKSAIQRLQAVIALMVGAFAFGVYSQSFETRIDTLSESRQINAERISQCIVQLNQAQSDIQFNRQQIQYLDTKFLSLVARNH